MRLVRTCLIAVFIACVLPASADAARSTFIVTDASGTLGTGPGCAKAPLPPAQQRAECPAGAIDTVNLNLGDGDDSATLLYPDGPRRS